MPNIVVIGAQWGDEGKGRIVDLISEKVDIIVRYQGEITRDTQLLSEMKRLFSITYLPGSSVKINYRL